MCDKVNSIIARCIIVCSLELLIATFRLPTASLVTVLCCVVVLYCLVFIRRWGRLVMLHHYVNSTSYWLPGLPKKIMTLAGRLFTNVNSLPRSFACLQTANLFLDILSVVGITLWHTSRSKKLYTNWMCYIREQDPGSMAWIHCETVVQKVKTNSASKGSESQKEILWRQGATVN